MMLAFMRAMLAAMFLTAAPIALAQPFPSKPVRIIVPVTGGSMDLFARLVAPPLSESLGQPVLVETKAGAGGNIATDYVAKGAADGHTVLITFNAPVVVNVTLFAKLPYDPLKDLAPIMLACTAPQFLVVHPSVPATSVKEFVDYVRANPRKFSYASIGVGSASHLTMEMLKAAAGLEIEHVAYKGSAPATTDVVAGQVPMAFLIPANALPHSKSGRLRVLASTGLTRAASLPAIPTLSESGFPGFESLGWIGLMVASGTPRPIVERYHREFTRILAIPDVREKLAGVDFDIVSSTPEAFGSYIRSEITKWAPVIRQTGARAE